ncbi:MAG: Chromosome segregation protein [Acidimicrobiales bacterium]|nr:Chromosome segregation protein [Acidimicrobiales bacterium]
MYISRLHLRNIKCFEDVEIDFSDENEPSGIRRWTVLLGSNGLGKSTLLQSIAICLAGPNPMRDLLPRTPNWARHGVPFGQVEGTLIYGDRDQQLPRWPKTTPYEVKFALTGPYLEALPESIRPMGTEVLIDWSGEEGTSKQREIITKSMNRLKQTAYAEDTVGWLGCGYGPFRRLSGGSQEADQVVFAGRRAARFVSLFREDAALSRVTSWLADLYNLGRDGDQAASETLAVVQSAIRDNFLLQPATLHVDARGATVQLGEMDPVPLGALSDGYRAMLALGLDLIRNIAGAFPQSPSPLEERGVVLIDELDAHLHPNWQRLIGGWLLDKFPNLQFIVATHSPFLTQVWPSSNFLLSQVGKEVKLVHDARSVVDWTVDQVMVELLGVESPRSVRFEAKLDRYQALRRKKELDNAEASEFKQLDLWADEVLDDTHVSDSLISALVERLENR